MDLFSLNCFVTLAKCSRFYEAAELLHLSQSSLSRHIQLVEHELGVKLFIRDFHGSELTPAGTGLLSYAENIIREYENAQLLLKEYSGNRENRLVVYTHSFLSHYHQTDMILDFQKAHPEIQLELQEFDSRYAVNALKDDPAAVSIVFSERDTTHESYDAHELMTDGLVLLVSARHQLAQSDWIDISALEDERFLIVPKESFIHNFILAGYKKAGFSPKSDPYVLWYSTMPEVIVKQNFAAIIPRRIAEHIYSPDMKILGIRDMDEFSVKILKNSNKTGIADIFFDFATNYTFLQVIQ